MSVDDSIAPRGGRNDASALWERPRSRTRSAMCKSLPLVLLRFGEVVLSDIKEAEQRIYANRVATLKQLSMVLADILIMHDVNIGRLSTGPEDYKLLSEWLDKKREQVLTLVEATPEESANLLRFRNLYDSFDSECERPQDDPGKAEALDRSLQKIREQFKREIS